MKTKDRPGAMSRSAMAAGDDVAGGAASLRLRAKPTCVLHDGRIIELEPKDGLLLAYLALEGPTARPLLAARLWPDVSAERARGNLRQRLLRLKRQVGFDLATGGSHPALAAQVAHDLADDADVLAPTVLDEAGGFAEWLDATRRAHRARRIDRLSATSAQAEGSGELAAALEHAQEVLALDPLSEHAHRRVMRLHYLRGDSAAARAAYARCAEQLARELGVAPAGETEALRRQIESGQPAARPARGPLPVTLLRPPTLIGREGPLQRLAEVWAGGAAFLLTGEGGIGKSRLLEEFVGGLSGAVLVSGRPSDRNLPLALLARLVRQIGSAVPQFAQHPRHAELLMFLPGGAEPPEGSPSRRLGAIFGAMLGVEGLGAIVVDDLQWIDDASLEALREARGVEAATHLRWGFASRPAEDEQGARRHERVRAEHGAEAIALEPLDASMLRRLVDSLMVVPGDADAIARELSAKVGGNPLFVLEALRQVHASGGDWARFEVPARVADLMDRRLQTISERALMLARVAAIAGTDFTAEAAEAVTGLDTLALASPWRELEHAHLLRAAAFTHDLALAAVQRSIPETIASRLHAKVAAYLEGIAADPARIARHHLAAGQEKEAVPFLAAAAQRAWLAGCSQEAADYFFRAADIELAAGRADAAFDIAFLAAEAMSADGSVELLERACDQLAGLARTPGQRAKARLVESMRAHVRGGDMEHFARDVDDVLVLAIAADERRVQAECRFSKAYVAAHLGHLNESLQHLAAAETLFRETGPKRRLLAVQMSIAMALGMVGQCERALELQRCLAPLLAPSQLIGARAHDAFCALGLGRIAEAVAAAASVERLLGSVDVGDSDWPSLAANAAAVFRSAGEYARALNLLDVVVARVGRQSPFAPVVDAERARVLLDLGRLDLATKSFAAFEHSDSAHVLGPQRHPVTRALMRIAAGQPALPVLEQLDPLTMENLRTASDWMLVRGRLPASERALRQNESLLARCTEQNLAGLRAPLLALAAKLHAELGEREAAADLAAQALPLLHVGIPAWLPLACTWTAAAFEAAGQHADARACVRIACDWIESTAGARVPEQFRESFRERNPVNRALLLASTQKRPRLASSRAGMTGAG